MSSSWIDRSAQKVPLVTVDENVKSEVLDWDFRAVLWFSWRASEIQHMTLTISLPNGLLSRAISWKQR